MINICNKPYYTPLKHPYHIQQVAAILQALIYERTLGSESAIVPLVQPLPYPADIQIQTHCSPAQVLWSHRLERTRVHHCEISEASQVGSGPARSHWHWEIVGSSLEPISLMKVLVSRLNSAHTSLCSHTCATSTV